MNDRKVCIVIPTYNNAGTIADVLQRTAAVAEDIIVVVDGSTDDTRERIEQWKGQTDHTPRNLHIIDYAENRGKGHALLEGFKCAIHKGYEYALTIDSDGQHFPEDIPLFITAMQQHPDAIIVGTRNLNQENMPGGNSFANRFSNFWFSVQTGIRLPDTQTGYRLYPLRHLSGVHLITSRYEAELELLVFAAWAGTKLVPIPVRVYYPPKGERVSHFRPMADFARISLLNTLFCFVALVYGWPRALWSKIIRHRWLAIAVLIAVVAGMTTLSLRMNYEEDIARFLPMSTEQKDYQQAVDQLTNQNRIVVVFTGETDSVKQAMDCFETRFAEVDTQHTVGDLQVTVDETQMLDMLAFVQSNAPYFLTVDDYARMDSLMADTGFVSRQLATDKQLLMLPTAGLATQSLSQDPLHLFAPVTERLQSISRNSRFTVSDGYILTHDGRHGLAFLSSPYGMSESGGNAKIATMLDEAIARTVGDCPQVSISATGGPLIAVSNATQIKHDSLLAVTIATVLILALLVWHYRRLQYLLCIAASIGFGWLFAMAGMSLLRDSVSIIVLGIGSVIIGIAVNYPLHYLDHLRETGNQRQTLRDMVKPLLIGNITTVSAFLCLLWVDAAAMRDLGLFGSLMLIGTILFVMVWGGYGAVHGGGEGDGGDGFNGSNGFNGVKGAYGIFWTGGRFPLVGLLALATVVLGYFSLQTSFDSDLRHINYMTDSQREGMELIASLSEDMTQDMSNMIPSKEVQQQRLQLWNDFTNRHAGLATELRSEARRQGFSADAFSPFVSLLENNHDVQPASYFQPVAQFLGGQHLINAKNVGSQLVEILQANFNYVSFVCGFVVFAFLWLSFGAIELALLSFLPLAVSWIWILGLMQLTGIQFNIVNIILATFIFGQGDDYTIFMTEGLAYEYATGQPRLSNYRRSILLSATLMFIGIGSLVLARHPALHSIATVTIIGMGTVVIMAFYLPPLVFRWLVRGESPALTPEKIKAGTALPITLRRTAYSLFAMGFFLVSMYLFLLPYTWLYFHVGKATEERKLEYHKLLQRIAGFVIRHVPGVRFNMENLSGETFSQPAVIIANHQSHLDLMCLMMLTPRIVFLTNDWVWHNPFYGAVIHRAEYYPVSNGIENNIDRLRSLYERGYSICVFPEGTRSEDCRILRFHKGAFYLAEQLGADLLPVYLHGVGHVLPKRDFLLREGRIDVEVGQRMKRAGDNVSVVFSLTLLEQARHLRHHYEAHYQQMCERIEKGSYWSPYKRYVAKYMHGYGRS